MDHKFYTIGYEGSQIRDFVDTLLTAGVETLLDVRDAPISRKPGFSKSALRGTLEAHGIRYVHLRGLGDPKPGRVAARQGDHQLFRSVFNAHMRTPVAQTDLSTATLLAQQGVVCLMCFERDHCGCHRSIVASHLVHLTGLSVHNLVIERKSITHDRRGVNQFAVRP